MLQPQFVSIWYYEIFMKDEYRGSFTIWLKKYVCIILLGIIPAHLIFPGIEYDTPASNNVLPMPNTDTSDDLNDHLKEM